ncbi:MAG: mannitol dehydrogenase family protein, partial [Clostridia bacterium]|nr:mannitol dehydrogenase family protein [Clostridia bacterium]
MKMNQAALAEREAWAKLGVKLPEYDVPAMVARTHENPIWVHFGAGNIFRGFIAALQQRLLNEGLSDRGIIAADTFDYEIITKIYDAFDNLTMNVTLNADATTSREIIASVAEGLRADAKDAGQMARFAEIFVNPSLQMVSFTITEKGYALRNMAGELMPVVIADMNEGPDSARHAMAIVCAMMFKRFNAGAYPIALVSMDNCSHNGEKLQSSIVTMAEEWEKKGFVDAGFVAYLKDEAQVAFPWS